MRLSVNELRRIIKEEVSRMLDEAYYNPEEDVFSKRRMPRSSMEPKAEMTTGAKINTIEDFQTWLGNFVNDPMRQNRKEDERLLLPSYATGDRRKQYYDVDDSGKLYLHPSLHAAIEGQTGEFKKLERLVPGGVVSGLPVEGPVKESYGSGGNPADYTKKAEALEARKKNGETLTTEEEELLKTYKMLSSIRALGESQRHTTLRRR